VHRALVTFTTRPFSTTTFVVAETCVCSPQTQHNSFFARSRKRGRRTLERRGFDTPAG
jgi:hypothetical protein